MGDLKRLARQLLAGGVYRSGLFALRMRFLARRHSLVLMYHRILPRDSVGPFLQPGMYVEPATFERHLLFLKKYFQVWPAEALYAGHVADAAQIPGRPACALTFDDGWADFYTHAFPLLVKHQVPALVFLPTGFIGTGRRFWTERLGRICASAMLRGSFAALQEFVRSKLHLTEAVATTNIAFQDQLIQCLKAYRLVDIEALLRQLESLFADISSDTGRDFLNWKEIEEMQHSGLVTFGAHTENHQLLNTLSVNEISRELVNSKQALLEHCADVSSALSFCYPNGNYTASAIVELGRNGYLCAFCTRNGWNDHATPCFELRRVGVHQDIAASDSLFAYRIFSAAVD